MTKIDHRRAPRPGGRSATVKAAVLRAAFDSLQHSGFPGLTIAGVAQASGVHETTIYRRWKTTAALALDASMQFARGVVGTPDTGSLRGDLIALGRDIAAAMESPPGRALLEICRLNDPEVAKARQAFFKERFGATMVIFERAARRGEFAGGDDTSVLIELLIAPLYFRVLVTGEAISGWPFEAIVDRLLHRRDGAHAAPQRATRSRKAQAKPR